MNEFQRYQVDRIPYSTDNKVAEIVSSPIINNNPNIGDKEMDYKAINVSNEKSLMHTNKNLFESQINKP